MSADRFGKTAVLMGGTSAEREVSLKSGQQVFEGLQAAGVDVISLDAGPDVIDALRELQVERVFNVLHGPWGEDGVIQGALETEGLPYTGSGVLGSALAMDKLRSKQLWSALGMPTPAYVVIDKDSALDDVTRQLGYPVFIKPANEGSSIGVSKVDSADALYAAWQQAEQFDGPVIAEIFIGGPEVTVGILQDQALPIIKLETPRTFYDYEAKYLADDTCYLCPSGLDADLEKQLQHLSLRAFDSLGCSGWGRVDLMLDQEMNPFLLEVNTVPGMTDHSLVPMAAKAAGLSFSDLVARILETSL